MFVYIALALFAFINFKMLWSLQDRIIYLDITLKSIGFKTD
jgi:hypothetical protein